MNITPTDDAMLDFAAIPSALRSVGIFTQGRMRVLADGRVEAGPRFRFAGWPVSYPIEGDDLPEGPARIQADLRVVDGEPRMRLLTND